MNHSPAFRRMLAPVLALALVCTLSLPASAFFWNKKTDVPSVSDFSKNGMVGQVISFSAGDFPVSGGSGGTALAAITLKTLPDIGTGMLTVGGQPLTEGALVDASALSGLQFQALPTPSVNETAFTFLPSFTTGETGEEVTVTLYLLTEANEAPIARNMDLSTYKNVAITGWFDAEDGTAYQLPPELDLICTAHYLEALTMQAKASQISAIIGGKMPHVMTLVPGGTAFVPTDQKLDELKALADEIYDWVESTMIPDTLAIAPYYIDALNWGKGCGRYVAWGVFEGPGDYASYTEQMANRYLPMGVIDDKLNLSDVQENLITEYMGRSWYKGDATYTSPYFVTEPEYTEYNVEDRYTWVKCPAYDGKPYEAGGLSRVLAAYKRNVPFVVEQVDGLLEALGAPGQIGVAQSTLGRTAVRQIETLYIAGLMKDWVAELIEALKSGDSEYFREPSTITGAGTGFWEAPRGALYHSESIKDGKIEGYQIIIPTTWNLAPINESGEHGPMEQALIGNPVGDIEKPINALRTVHSFDPCTACAVHITEPATGKSFETVTSPWGVK